MLQVKNLVKRYTTKGETVTALDGVTIDFPERGMVFLLGKSGSGKSTLLNVSGGLDAPDEGEVIVKGKSSNDFSKSDFDSYRNTYVGFIFQEYNILNELTVSENIALAIELQGKPRDRERVEELLRAVDLEGFGDRRPNTLSGGQKQRVAIARALVKNPEIIMADEPTGALDSATGMQVFETLKKLSQEKLVVVVSHDREFAERYADRIIELKDGKIISDLSRNAENNEKENLVELSDKKLSVSCGEKLTGPEIEKIINFLKRNRAVVLSAEREETREESAAQSGFAETRTAPAAPQKDESKFIKSRFPLRYAFKMGLSGLRFKPVRLVFTTLLATFAFIVFGIFSTLITYDPGIIAARVLDGSGMQSAVLTKKMVCHRYSGTVEFPTAWDGSANFLTEDVEELNRAFPDMHFVPVFSFLRSVLALTPSQGTGGCTTITERMRNFSGFSDAAVALSSGAVELVEGRLPQASADGVDEAAISLETFQTFREAGYRQGVYDAQSAVTPVSSFSDLEGKTITIGAGAARYITVRVVGLIDTHEDFSRFEDAVVNGALPMEQISDLEAAFNYSLSSVCFVHSTFYDNNNTLDSSADYYEYFYRLSNEYGRTAYSEAPADGRRYQKLYVSLAGDRTERCEEFMRSVVAFVNEEKDIAYSAPYHFLLEIEQGETLINQLFSMLGLAAALLAVFAALLLFNFISTSINVKKHDIGILRAVGARGTDVFKIFIVEGLAITLFCFVLGCIGSFGACALVNAFVISQKAASFEIFLFGWLNVLFVLAIALATAFIATAIPVALTVRKKPVEAIRAL